MNIDNGYDYDHEVQKLTQTEYEIKNLESEIRALAMHLTGVKERIAKQAAALKQHETSYKNLKKAKIVMLNEYLLVKSNVQKAKETLLDLKISVPNIMKNGKGLSDKLSSAKKNAESIRKTMITYGKVLRFPTNDNNRS